MSKFGDDLIQSLTEAVEHAEGKEAAAWVQVIEVPEAGIAPIPPPQRGEGICLRYKMCESGKPSWGEG